MPTVTFELGCVAYLVVAALTYRIVHQQGKSKRWSVIYGLIWPEALPAAILRPKFYRDTFPAGSPGSQRRRP